MDGLTALGMSASQSNDFVDMLSATIVSSNTGVAQMQGAFENVAPIAGTLNISMSDLSVALGLMANQGVKAEKAGTALKNLLTNMASPTEAMTKAIQKYNLEGAQKLITDGKLVEGIKEMKTQLEGLTASEKASVISTIAGKEALSGVSALLNSSTNDINSLKFAVDSSTKSSRAYAMSLGLIDKKTGEVKVDVNNLTKEQQKAYDQWQNFNSIMEETTDTMTLVGGSTTDLGAIIARFGEDASSDKVNNVLDFFDKMENAQGKAIEKMKQYGIELKRNDDGSIDFGETLKDVAVKWDDLTNSQKKALAEQLGFKGSIEDLNDLFGNEGEKIEELVDVYEEMEGVSEHLAKSFDATLKGSILSLSSAIGERLLQTFDKIKPAVQGVIETLKTFFDIWNGMSDKFSNLKGFGDAIGYLEEQSRSWGESIKNGLSSAISSIDEFINSTSFDNVLQIGTNIINGICDGIIKAYDNGSLTSAISGFITKICNWITTNGDKVQKAGKDIINAIKEGIITNRESINDALETAFGIVNTFINGKNEIFQELGISCGAKLIEGMLKGVMQDAVTSLGSAVTFLVTTLGGLTADLFQAGIDLAKSILDGFMEWWLGADTWEKCKREIQEFVEWYKELDKKASKDKNPKSLDEWRQQNEGKDINNEEQAIKYADQTIDTYKKRISERLASGEIQQSASVIISKALDRAEEAKKGADETTKTYINELQGQLANGEINESSFNSILSGLKQTSKAKESADETTKGYIEQMEAGLSAGTIDPSSVGAMLSVLSESEQVNTEGSKIAQNYMDALRENLVTGQITPEEFRVLALGDNFMENAKEYAKTNQIKADDVIDAKSFSNVEEVNNLMDALDDLNQKYADMSSSVTDACKSMADGTREGMLSCANIIINQVTNARDTFTQQFISMSKVASTQLTSVRTAVVSKFISINKVITTQCTNARDNLTRQFMSMSRVASTQLTSVRTAVVSKMMSIARVVGTQAKLARDNLTRQFMSMDRVVATQMAKCLSTVQSYMAQIQSATNKQMTMKFKVEKTITTTNVTKNVEKGMKTTMSSMNSNMMGVGSPNIMSAGGLGTININANTGGGISGNLALEVPLYLDGKEIARATAKYNEAELAKLNKRNKRKRGE